MWRPKGTSESYDGGYTSCNGYGFEFSELQSAALTDSQPFLKVRSFADSGYSLRTLAADTIVVNRR